MSTNTISLRVDSEELERIDRAAKEHGESRTDYILGWIPEHYDRTAPAPDPRRNANSRLSALT